MRFDRSTLNGAVFSDCSERIVDHFGESMSSGRISPGSRRYVSRWVMFRSEQATRGVSTRHTSIRPTVFVSLTDGLRHGTFICTARAPAGYNWIEWEIPPQHPMFACSWRTMKKTNAQAWPR